MPLGTLCTQRTWCWCVTLYLPTGGAPCNHREMEAQTGVGTCLGSHGVWLEELEMWVYNLVRFRFCTEWKNPSRLRCKLEFLTKLGELWP